MDLHLYTFCSNQFDGRHVPNQSQRFSQCGFLTLIRSARRYLCGYTRVVGGKKNFNEKYVDLLDWIKNNFTNLFYK